MPVGVAIKPIRADEVIPAQILPSTHAVIVMSARPRQQDLTLAAEVARLARPPTTRSP
jgi:hypothetical protein